MSTENDSTRDAPDIEAQPKPKRRRIEHDTTTTTLGGMESLKEFLIPYEDVMLVPPNAYSVYDMSGGRYYVLQKHYDGFMTTYLHANKGAYHLTLDLNKAVSHAVCLDLDGALSASQIDYYVDNVLVPGLKDFFTNLSFSILVTQKPTVHSGLHVFLPDFKISNDDYEWLCYLIKSNLAYTFPNTDNSIKLDYPKNFNLPFSSKVNDQSYLPTVLVLVSEHDNTPVKLRLSAANSNIDTVKKILTRTPKKNTLKHLAFMQYVNQIPQNRYIVLGRLMSPINCYHALKVRNLSFATTLKESNDQDGHELGRFRYTDTKQSTKYIYKGAQIFTTGTQLQSIDIYYYLKSQVFRIDNLESSLASINSWWAFNIKKVGSIYGSEDVFQDLNLRLKRDYKHIRDADHPIKTILTFRDNLFFMPVFYALCNEVNVTFSVLCESLRTLLGDDHVLLRRVSRFNEDLVRILAEKYTYHTILYCVGNMHPPVKDLLSKVKIIIENEAADIERNVQQERVVNLMCHIITTYFPIHRNDKDKKFIWNPVQGKWLLVNREDDIKCILITITDCLFAYYQECFDTKCPFKSVEIRDKCYTTITSKNFMENDYLNLDFRYWLLRTNEGCLDLLTLGTSMIVPENYLSEKTLLPKFANVSKYIGDPSLRQTYGQLWNKQFFDEYVRRLKEGEDEDDDYLTVLKEMTLPNCTDGLLHAYTHLCKYLRFNFEEMKYFIHVLATTLIATNYGKYLFILQGHRNNGKSRLFIILHTIFGQYLGLIDNETLSMSRKSDLKPELVRALYTCRLTAVEEFAGNVNENLIKNITANCMVTYRALYDTHIIGVPMSKLFVTTNKPLTILITEAFKARVNVFQFSAKFIPDLALGLAQQIEQSKFKVILDETFLKDTALGFFLHMSFLLEEYVSLEDGFLHYPPVPESLVAFKEEYLKITDIYFQFKIYMDIQTFPGEMTTLSEVKSAIRHFLKATKNNISIDENELLNQFDNEYKDCIFYPEDQILFSDSDDSEEEEELLPKRKRSMEEEDDNEPKRKKMKMLEEEVLPGKRKKRDSDDDDEQNEEPKRKKTRTENLCYRDVVIKGLKKTRG